MITLWYLFTRSSKITSAPWILRESYPLPLNFSAAITSSSPEETFNLGENLAFYLEKGSIVALEGPLGAGKTCFAKGIASGLGVIDELTSPTYTIISEYQGFSPRAKDYNIPIYHIDAYRLRGNDDFSAIGGEEIVFGNGISIIEWSDNIPGFIPPEAFMVKFDILESNKRVISISRT